MNLSSLKNYFNYILFNTKFHFPRNQSVIDIGSGHSPLVRADILCDLFPLETSQRPVAGIYTPPHRFVVGNVLDLPFGTKTFDFAYSRALLEHVLDPEKACGEISRIAKGGLLRLPSYLWEIMGGSNQHLWLIFKENDTLVFQRKTREHERLKSQIPEIIRNSRSYEQLFNAFDDYFYITYYWKEKIKVKVVNDVEHPYIPKDDAPLSEVIAFHNKFKTAKGILKNVKVFLFETFRSFLGGKNLDLFSYAACPLCKQSFQPPKGNYLICEQCKVQFPIIDDIPFLIRECANKL